MSPAAQIPVARENQGLDPVLGDVTLSHADYVHLARVGIELGCLVRAVESQGNPTLRNSSAFESAKRWVEIDAKRWAEIEAKAKANRKAVA